MENAMTPDEIHEGLIDLMQQGRVRAYLHNGQVVYVADMYWRPEYECTELSIDDVNRLYTSGELE